MSRSKRKMRSSSENPSAPLKLCRGQPSTITQFKWSSEILRNESDTDTLLHYCFARMLPHVWMKIVPSAPDDVENMAFAIGQSWQLLQELLLRTKYIYKFKNTFRLNVLKFEALVTMNKFNLTLHFGKFRPRGCGVTYYLCRSNPIYINPESQIRDNYSYSSLKFNDGIDLLLRDRIVASTKINASPSESIFTRAVAHKSAITTTNVETVNLLEPNANNMIVSSSELISNEISEALSLDLSIFPRYMRKNESERITIKTSKNATGKERMLIIIESLRWGYSSNTNTYNDKIRIVKAASRLIAYDNGYAKEFHFRTVIRWIEEIHHGISHGISSTAIAEPENKGSVAYTDTIEVNYPGYLTELFRTALRTKGRNSGFEEIGHQMNALSAVDTKNRPTLLLTRRQVNEWFISLGGKQLSPLEKPLDTKKHAALRIDWVVERYGLLTNPFAPVCYIDEKWFYRVNRRRKIKHWERWTSRDQDNVIDRCDNSSHNP